MDFKVHCPISIMWSQYSWFSSHITQHVPDDVLKEPVTNFTCGLYQEQLLWPLNNVLLNLISCLRWYGDWLAFECVCSVLVVMLMFVWLFQKMFSVFQFSINLIFKILFPVLQVSFPVDYTPRKFVIHHESAHLIITETEHNAYTEDTKKQRRIQMAEVCV
jgi:hypothetical protein